MATKIGGDQIRLEDFIKNPAPEANWNSMTETASQAAIKGLVEGSVGGNGTCFVLDSEILTAPTEDVYYIKEAKRSNLGSSMSLYKKSSGNEVLVYGYSFDTLQRGIKHYNNLYCPGIDILSITVNWETLPTDGTEIDFGQKYILNSKKTAPEYVYRRLKYAENLIGYNNRNLDKDPPQYEFDGAYLYFSITNFTSITIDPTAVDLSWAPFGLLHCGKTYVLQDGETSGSITINTFNLQYNNFKLDFIIPNIHNDELIVSIDSDKPDSYPISGLTEIKIPSKSVARVQIAGVRPDTYHGIPYSIYVTASVDTTQRTISIPIEEIDTYPTRLEIDPNDYPNSYTEAGHTHIINLTHIISGETIDVILQPRYTEGRNFKLKLVFINSTDDIGGIRVNIITDDNHKIYGDKGFYVNQSSLITLDIIGSSVTERDRRLILVKQI